MVSILDLTSTCCLRRIVGNWGMHHVWFSLPSQRRLSHGYHLCSSALKWISSLSQCKCVTAEVEKRSQHTVATKLPERRPQTFLHAAAHRLHPETKKWSLSPPCNGKSVSLFLYTKHPSSFKASQKSSQLFLYVLFYI